MVKHIDKVARAYNAEKYYFKSKKVAKIISLETRPIFSAKIFFAANNNEVDECNVQHYF